MSVPASPVSRVLSLLKGVKREGGDWVALCPGHEDRKPSLSVAEGDDGRALIYCRAGCNWVAVLSAIGLEKKDLFATTNGKGFVSDEITDTYPYVDEDGELLYQVLRTLPKGFRQRRPNGRGGWDWTTKGTRNRPWWTWSYGLAESPPPRSSAWSGIVCCGRGILYDVE